MIEPQSPRPMTLEEYDRLTPPEGEQYELYDGFVYAFSTGSGTHGILCTRIATALDSRVRTPCRVFGASNIGVRRHDRATNVIPDGTVTCEDFDLRQTYVVTPILVAEVISPRSVKRDRVTKLDIYRDIPSIEEYLMVDSRRIWVSIERRMPDGRFITAVHTSLEDTVELFSVDVRILLADLYGGVEPSRRKTPDR
jgi:Uma2 family endonuclease